MHSTQPHIIVQQANYTTQDGLEIIRHLNLSFGLEKVGIVGRNGIGKTTLLKLLVGQVAPTTGSIKVYGTLAYSPQQSLACSGKTVAELLGIEQQLAALIRIEQGSIDERDYELVGDNWQLRDRVNEQLTLFGLTGIELERPLPNLSGGEQARLMLTRVFLQAADFTLLDEPTNNLDIGARERLYQVITNWHSCLLVVGHDRKLLNLMDMIIELTCFGAAVYGGGYDQYIKQKRREEQAKQQQLQTSLQGLNQAKKLVQQRKERHQQNEARGRSGKKAEIAAKGYSNKMSLNKARERSEHTVHRLSIEAGHKLQNINDKLEAVRAKIEIVEQIKVELPKTYVPTSKVVVEIKNLTFGYAKQKLLFSDFNLLIQGPQRLALVGNNGSGKTTLIKLILGELMPVAGQTVLGVEHISYLDQHAALLNPQLTLIENFQLCNPELSITEVRHVLAQFLFRKQEPLQPISNLSGGEKLRALLACILKSKRPPQLLILDEPANHLDLASISKIEEILSCYQGAMLIISHDESFLHNIGVQAMIRLPT